MHNFPQLWEAAANRLLWALPLEERERLEIVKAVGFDRKETLQEQRWGLQ
jgi:hypothetical protein